MPQALETAARTVPDGTDVLTGTTGALRDRSVVRLALVLAGRRGELTAQISELTCLMTVQAPALMAIPGCGVLTATKILGETAGADRFRSKDAYARHNGTAPLPVWSSNKACHRLSRTGNRQLNAALHRIAMTQAHWHPAAKDLMDRRKAMIRPETP